MFLTPYADADVAALTTAGNDADLRSSFTAGDDVGQDTFGRKGAPASLPAGRRQLSAIAWPAGGVASGPLLDNLATANVNTVILTAPASPVSYTPGAVASTLTGPACPCTCCLPTAPSPPCSGRKPPRRATAGAIFRVSQQYIAETAMIAAEQPGTLRPIVVAPPRRWDPARRLASGLLADTVQAPWLRPSTTGQLVTMPSEHVYGQLTQSAAGHELSAKLLRKVTKLDRRIALLQSIRLQPDPALKRAVFSIESAAWRGKAVKRAWALLARTSQYVESQLGRRSVFIRGGARHATYHVTFGGKTSTVPVAINNGLPYQVRVGLVVKATNATVTGEPRSITIAPLSISSIKLTVRVESNQGRIRLSLVAPPHSALAGHRLPAYPLIILVHPTDFGTVALVICAAVLALFVIGSAVRAIRHGRGEPGRRLPTRLPKPTRRSPPDCPKGPNRPLRPGPRHRRRGQRGRRVGSRPVGSRLMSPAGPTDGSRAATPARTAWPNSPSGRIAPPDPLGTLAGDGPIPERGFVDLGNRPEHTDSVGDDQSELTSAGPPVNDQEPAAPSRRATEERR